MAYLNPSAGEVQRWLLWRLSIVAHDDLAGDYPSKVDPRWLDPGLGRNAYLQQRTALWTGFRSACGATAG